MSGNVEEEITEEPSSSTVEDSATASTSAATGVEQMETSEESREAKRNVLGRGNSSPARIGPPPGMIYSYFLVYFLRYLGNYYRL